MLVDKIVSSMKTLFENLLYYPLVGFTYLISLLPLRIHHAFADVGYFLLYKVFRYRRSVVTINLVDVALSSGKDMDKFWQIFDERLELCYRGLMCRHNRLKGTLSDAAPILWQYGALARLEKGEPIDKLLYGGYSTISLGYAGLWECVVALNGKKLTEPEGEKLGLEIMKKLNEFTAKWKAAENIDYSLYGTPIESTTYRFSKCLQQRFGVIKGVTDRNYITNSYHIHVTEPIDAFKKLEIEAKFQRLSPGGAISYVEAPNMQDNIPAVLSIMQYIYDGDFDSAASLKSDMLNLYSKKEIVKGTEMSYEDKILEIDNRIFEKSLTDEFVSYFADAVVNRAYHCRHNLTVF